MTCFPFVRYHFSSYLIFLIFYLIFIRPFRTRLKLGLFSDFYLGLRRLRVLLQESRSPSARPYYLSQDPIEILHRCRRNGSQHSLIQLVPLNPLLRQHVRRPKGIRLVLLVLLPGQVHHVGLSLHLLPQQGHSHLGLREPHLHPHQEPLHLEELVMVLVQLRLLNLRGRLPKVELTLDVLDLWRSLSAKRSFLIKRSPTLFDNKSI